MTQEQKDLLLKDLCARLPYGVKVKFGDSKPALLTVIEQDEFGWQIGSEDEFGGMITIIDNVKPYLFPLSSMSEEQKYDFYCRFIENDCDFDDFKGLYLDNGMWHKLLTSLDDIEALIDWFHKNHIDYRGLIPMGLAIDATDKNIY
jgi:hypothetical protein